VQDDRQRRHNGAAICAACAQFIVICRNIGLLPGRSR
jgi:hypothetical protein